MGKITYIRSILIVNMFALNVGIYMGWTPWLVHNLKRSSSTMNLTVDELTWNVSLPQLGVLLCGIVALLVGNHIGRKTMLICATFPFVCGWTTLFLSNTLLVICLARIIMGISAGITYTLIPTYFSEIALVNHRGLITSSQSFSMQFGILLMNVYCTFISLNNISALPIVLTIICGVLLWTVPETPHYLLLRKDYDQATNALEQLREVYEEKEMQIIVEHVENHNHNLCDNWRDLFLVSHNRKMILVVTLIVITSQFSGSNVIACHMNDILLDLGKNLIMAHVIIVTSGIVCFANLGSMLLVDRLGRKNTFLLSMVGGGIGCFIIAICSFLRKNGYEANVVSNIGIAGIMIFFFMFNLGHSSVLSVITAELFATNVRTFGVAYQTCLSTICIFLALKIFGILIERCAMYFTFGIFIVFVIITIFLSLRFLPETSGKTFVEIQEVLAEVN